MRPFLFSIGSFNFSSLGFFLFLAFLLFAFLVWKKAKEKLYSEEVIFDAIFSVSFFFLIGARISYIFLNFPDFGINPFKWLLFTGYPGFYFYGGLIFALFSLYYFFRKTESKVPFWEMFDFFVFAFYPSYILAQIGALLAGSETGKETKIWWAIKNFGEETLRHPVSLYRATLLLLFFVIIVRFQKTLFVRKGMNGAGLLGLTLMFVFSLINFLVDNFLVISVYYLSLSFNQWVNLSLLVFWGWQIYKKTGYKLRLNLLNLFKKNV